jgi:hypothetical protein
LLETGPLDEKRRDLILAIAQVVGFGGQITTAEVLRAYGAAAVMKADELAMLEVDIRLAEARKKAKDMNLPGWS